MSVVVRMEMPENCEECHFRVNNSTTNVPNWTCAVNKWSTFYCKKSHNHADEEKYLVDCPIICQLSEGPGRLVDADAYSAEMKDRQEAAWKWRNEAIAEEDELKLERAEGAFTAFTEAKLTMEKHIISPWHRTEDPPKKTGKYVVCWTYQEKIYWDWLIFIDGNWELHEGLPLPDYWMTIEPPIETERSEI